MTIAVGLAGRMRAGKDAVARRMGRYGFAVFNYSDEIIGPVLRSLELPPVRECYIAAYAELGTTADNYAHRIVRERGITRVVFPNSRMQSHLDYWRSAGLERFYLVRVAAIPDVRYARWAASGRDIDRGRTDRETFNRLDAEEVAMTPGFQEILQGPVDFDIGNNGTLDQLHAQVDAFALRFGLVAA